MSNFAELKTSQKASEFGWQRLLALTACNATRSYLPGLSFPNAGGDLLARAAATVGEPLDHLRGARNEGTWSHELAGTWAVRWGHGVAQSADGHVGDDLDRWVLLHCDPDGYRALRLWPLIFPELTELLQADPTGVILTEPIASTVLDVVGRTIGSLLRIEWFEEEIRLAVTPSDLNAVELALGDEENGALPATVLITNNLVSVATCDSTWRAWLALKDVLTNSQIDEVVAAAASVSERFPHLPMAPDRIQQPDWI